MSKERKDENAKYRTIIKKYRRHFGLLQGDIASLLDIDENRYSGIESGRRTLDINISDEIAGLYNLKYYKMGNPSQVIPKIEDLPKATQEIIATRVGLGIKLKNTDRNLGFYLDQLINGKGLDEPITAKEIWEQLPENVKKSSSPTEITNLFNKKPRNKIITKVDKKGKEYLFQLKKLAKK
ncbi:Helix-turn-helix [Mucilaginibacter pineti]|uniref:Helix-turn-helix n=1 Tax=Mucilaginibacter pineti TaxID=1391627 RepID=A0A1G7H342_9SPHI|nr:helix-turn-helix transcriptional regulator [Mucilaginibacter pineti]SDE94569.1 Helix-turn-helix [Mucilaginibacter pineti]